MIKFNREFEINQILWGDSRRRIAARSQRISDSPSATTWSRQRVNARLIPRSVIFIARAAASLDLRLLLRERDIISSENQQWFLLRSRRTVVIFSRNELGAHQRRILYLSQLGVILHWVSQACISVLYCWGVWLLLLLILSFNIYKSTLKYYQNYRDIE